MPQPVYQDVHVASALTNIAVAYLQDDNNYVADKLFPIVPVVHQTDKYFFFSKDDFFRDEAQLRADATESAGTGFNLLTQTYSANVWALHKDIGDQVRRNADPAVDIDMATTRFLMQKMLIKRDRFFVQNYIKNGIWGTDITGVASNPSAVQTTFWNDDANGDPFTDVANAQTQILQNTSFMPNVLMLSWPVYQALRKHPLVIDRIKYTTATYAGTITPQLLAEAFDIERVVISKGVYNTSQEGVAGVYSFIIGKDALLLYAAPAPGLMVPSAGYIFSWSGFTDVNNIGVRTLQIPMPWLGKNTIRTECEMAFDMPIVSSDLGYHFSGIVQ